MAIESLIVIGGISGVGKTTLLRNLKAGGPALLPRELRVPAGSAWKSVNAMEVASQGATDLHDRTVFLHYDLFRPITFYGALDFASDPALSILDDASSLAAITLWEDIDLLIERSERRRRALWRKLFRAPVIRGFPSHFRDYSRARLRRRRMRPWFDDPDRLRQLHARWFEFCRTRGMTDHWIARPSAGLEYRRLGAGIPPPPFRPISTKGGRPREAVQNVPAGRPDPG